MTEPKRIGPVRRLLEPGRAPGGTGARRRLVADPARAWAGRLSLDRARVRDRPDDADSWWRLGLGLHVLGRHDEAGAAFLRALRRDLAVAERSQVLVVTDSTAGLDRTLELVGTATDRTPVELLWICTTPVLFDAARECLADLDGRVYRIDPCYVEPLLRDARMPRVRAAACVSAGPLAPMPRRVQRLRIPVAPVEARPDDADGFDRLLAVSRESARRWATADGPAVQPVVWPDPRPRAGGGDVPAVVVATEPSVGGAEAWPRDVWEELLPVAATELREHEVVLWPDPARRGPAVAAWRRWAAHADADARDRVRVALGDAAVADSHPATLIVCEPGLAARARHLRATAAVAVFDPDDTIDADPLPRARTPWHVVEIAHAVRRDPAIFAAARDRAAADLLFTEVSSSAPRLADVLASLHVVEDAGEA